jgi:SSS family solute:Na+ symporter
MFINWLIGVILVYSILFGTGKLILGDFTSFTIYLIIAAISVAIIYINLSKIGWKTVIK